jgi:hypothetical protein
MLSDSVKSIYPYYPEHQVKLQTISYCTVSAMQCNTATPTGSLGRLFSLVAPDRAATFQPVSTKQIRRRGRMPRMISRLEQP